MPLTFWSVKENLFKSCLSAEVCGVKVAGCGVMLDAGVLLRVVCSVVVG